jgi:SsrA-binding protein
VANPKDQERQIAGNKRARFEFEILEELECGMVLTGTEVKSLRGDHGSIAEAYGLIRNGELFLIGSHIPEYKQGNVHNHAPARERKLLVSRHDIDRWYERVKVKGITIVPLSLYFKGSRVKIKMALARGKKLYDKRATQREKDDKREMDRATMRRR